eukprot:3401867-Prymnesium_polylepis.1
MGAASTAPAGPSLYDQRPHAVAAHLALRLRGRECRGKMLSRAEVGSLRRIGSRRPNGGTVQVGTLMFARRLRSPEARGPSALREGGRHLRVVQVRASVGAHAPCRCGARWGEPCLSCGSRAAVEGRSRRELYACRGGTPMASSGACAFVCGRQLGACVRCVVLPRDRRVVSCAPPFSPLYVARCVRRSGVERPPLVCTCRDSSNVLIFEQYDKLATFCIAAFLSKLAARRSRPSSGPPPHALGAMDIADLRATRIASDSLRND